MAAAWMRARADLRARWREAVVLGLVIGVTAAMAMTAAAGARRVATSYDRLLAERKAYDVEVQLTGDNGDTEAHFETGLALLDAVGRLPQVVDRAKIAFVPAMRGTPGTAPGSFSWTITTIAAIDPTFTRTFEPPTIVGIPAGVAGGRWAWALLSDRLGVDAPPVAPALSIALGALGVIALANLVAMAPARVAARTQPAEILRTE